MVMLTGRIVFASRPAVATMRSLARSDDVAGIDDRGARYALHPEGISGKSGPSGRPAGLISVRLRSRTGHRALAESIPLRCGRLGNVLRCDTTLRSMMARLSTTGTGDPPTRPGSRLSSLRNPKAFSGTGPVIPK